MSSAIDTPLAAALILFNNSEVNDIATWHNKNLDMAQLWRNSNKCATKRANSGAIMAHRKLAGHTPKLRLCLPHQAENHLLWVSALVHFI